MAVPHTFAFASSSSPSFFSLKTKTTLPIPSISLCLIPSKKSLLFPSISPSTTKFARIRAAVPEDAVSALDTANEIVSSSPDDGVSTVVSALLFVAFIGLSLLTVGVIYLAVTDFLQKREKEKFEKEEAANSGNKKKKKVRARAGPKGFGQKLDDDNDD